MSPLKSDHLAHKFDHDALKIRLVVVADSVGLALSQSRASDKHGFSIIMVYTVLLFILLRRDMVEVVFFNCRCDAVWFGDAKH